MKMKIGLIDIEPKIFNTAYMQIAQYHKERGDTVEWWSPLTDRQFDHLYCSSLFDFTDKSEVPTRAIRGGTGFDVISRLSVDMESCQYDYSIYPKCKTSFVWFSRGCNRNCPWCVVPQKEGKFHTVKPKNLNPYGEYITVCDNNFLFGKDNSKTLLWLFEKCQKVDIQGVDIRTITEKKCRELRALRHCRQIKIAWDNPKEDLVPVLKGILRIIPAWRWMCYVLIGYSSTPEEDLYRVETLEDLGIDPFVMPYNKRDLYQAMFSRWVNRKQIFKTCTWEQYQLRKLGKIVFK